jgi:Asp-tRNA(Asn)/Glu-tRNA(Gln) amidotransferase A subunit family amidase
MTTPDDLCFATALDIAAAIRAGTVSPVEVVDAIAARIDRVNPLINAYCTPALDQTRAAARTAGRLGDVRAMPALHGVPVAIKDDLPVAGLRYTEGSRLHADRVAQEDDPTVQRLKAARAIVLGKTNEPECGAGIRQGDGCTTARPGCAESLGVAASCYMPDSSSLTSTPAPSYTPA